MIEALMALIVIVLLGVISALLMTLLAAIDDM